MFVNLYVLHECVVHVCVEGQTWNHVLLDDREGFGSATLHIIHLRKGLLEPGVSLAASKPW